MEVKHTKNQTPLTRHGLKQFFLQPGILTLTVIIILIGALIAILYLTSRGEPINRSGYQVVYMATGQAYFGRLQNDRGTYLVLKEPYSAQDVTAKDNDTKAAETSTTLLKVSQQQYGPEDTMSLKSDQVLFWQNLRDDSKVTQAINSKQ